MLDPIQIINDARIDSLGNENAIAASAAWGILYDAWYYLRLGSAAPDCVRVLRYFYGDSEAAQATSETVALCDDGTLIAESRPDEDYMPPEEPFDAESAAEVEVLF